MYKGFVLEFSVDISVDDSGVPEMARFRVVVEWEATAYIAFDGPFGEAWARVIDEPERGAVAYGAKRPATWSAPLREDRIIALAIRGTLVCRTEHRIFEQLPNGREIIKLGTVKREA